MLKRNPIIAHSVGGCQKWEPAGRFGDFENFFNDFAKSPRVLPSSWIFKWVKFVLQNSEILHSLRGLYDKFSASKYRLTSDVMYKKYQRLFYTPQICWQVNLSNAKKIRPDLFSKNLFSRPNLPWSRAAISLKCDRSLLLFLCVCAYKAINSM